MPRIVEIRIVGHPLIAIGRIHARLVVTSELVLVEFVQDIKLTPVVSCARQRIIHDELYAIVCIQDYIMPIAQVLSKHASLEDILEVLAHVGIQVCLESLVPLETVHDNGLYLICSVLIRKILVRDLDSLLEYNDQRINQFHRTLECLGAKVNPPEIQ